MEYIKEMRKLVGHAPIMICACGCLIFNKKGQVLLQRRSDDDLWGNPGGSMDLGETIYETIIREIKEETNLAINKENLKIFNIYSGEDQHHIYPNNDEVYFVNIIFETNTYRGTIKSDSESYELKFFDINNLPTNITKPFECVARDLKLRVQNDNI
ncbi:MAG: NUDIX domain-containing protein [Bacilli bacterium]|nr:NUDIX domain-containing protein [Bacilli bacterium]